LRYTYILYYISIFWFRVAKEIVIEGKGVSSRRPLITL
jgi:hypothetical protein